MVQIIEINKKKFSAPTAQQKVEVEEKIKKMQKEGEKMVKGRFEFVDAQGGWLDFTFRFFKDDPLRTYRIMHGEECTLPMILIRHLNNVYKKVRLPPSDWDKGKPQLTKISRCRFTSMELM